MSDQRYRTVLLFGTPGVGKGTQGRILGGIPGLFHLSSGEIFRSLNGNSAETRRVLEYCSRGELVPDELTVRIWRRWLDHQIQEGQYNPQADLLILDGIPRNVHQCEMLQDYLQVLRVIHLVCPDESIMVQRIKERALIEGRMDDAQEHVIRRRFKIYREESEPVLQFYPHDLVDEVDPIGLPTEVLHRILACLIPVQKEMLAAVTAGQTH